MSGVRAAVMTAPGRIEIEEFPRPSVEPGAVLLKVIYSGICGTDKHTFRGETKQYAGTPHERALEYPLICGPRTSAWWSRPAARCETARAARCGRATGSCPAPTSPAANAGSAAGTFPTTPASGWRTTATA